MHRDEDIDLSRRKYSSRLIIEGALRRGWHITGFESNPAIYLIDIPGRSEPIPIFSASPPQTSYPADKIAKDKFITSQILAMKGVAIPAQVLVNQNYDPDVLSAFLREHGTVVAKPLDGAHGNGITVDIRDPNILISSVKAAIDASINGIALVQKQIEGVDVRVVCINYEYCDAISRVPAMVKGDGIHTVKELIEIENGQPYRGENYRSRLCYINFDKAAEYLGPDQLARVPNKDEEVRVIGVSNVGMGGERLNLKSQIPKVLQDLAVKVSRVMQLPVSGVDFFVKKLPEPGDTLEDLDPVVIEVNDCPALPMYDDLGCPDQLAIVDAYLDLVAQS